MLKRVLLMLTLGVAGSAPAGAQDLVSLIPTLYGPGGITVDTMLPAFHGFTHRAHFQNSFLTEFGSFNQAFASQLSAEALPSPASGFTYTLDPDLGVLKRSTKSFGPILSDRAETIGKGKFAFGFNYQHFDFDSLGGVDLHSLNSVLPHLGAQNPRFTFTYDVVTVSANIDAKVNQFTAFGTYGLMNRLDLSVALPFETIDLSADGVASIQRLGTLYPGGLGAGVHFFSSTFPSMAHKSGTANGVGDLLLRLKATALKSGDAGLALGLDTRLPTGNEKNLLGTGAASFRPFVDFSYAGKTVSPHLKVAYQVSTKSYLGVGGNAATVQSNGALLPLVKGDLPKEFFYEAGADVAVSKKVTVAVDLLGKRFINAERAFATQYSAPDPGGTIHPFGDTGTSVGSFNTAEGAIGAKANLFGNFLLDANVLFNLDHNGLHHKVSPLVGIEYSF